MNKELRERLEGAISYCAGRATNTINTAQDVMEYSQAALNLARAVSVLSKNAMRENPLKRMNDGKTRDGLCSSLCHSDEPCRITEDGICDALKKKGALKKCRDCGIVLDVSWPYPDCPSCVATRIANTRTKERMGGGTV